MPCHPSGEFFRKIIQVGVRTAATVKSATKYKTP